MKKQIIRFFGLKGSWTWAKRQMMNGEMVRCKHWSGALKLKIDSASNTLLKANYTNTPNVFRSGDLLWETSNHHLKYEDFTDYEIFNW